MIIKTAKLNNNIDSNSTLIYYNASNKYNDLERSF